MVGDSRARNSRGISAEEWAGLHDWIGGKRGVLSNDWEPGYR